MINKTILSITLGSFTLMASGAMAAAASTTTTTGSTTPSTTGSTTPSTTGSTGGTSYITPSGGGNAADSGRSAQNIQLIGSAVGVGVGVAYMDICPTWAGSWACPLAAMALVGAASLNSASGGSGAAGSAMSAYDPAAYGTGTTSGTTVDQWGNVVNTGGSTGTGPGPNIQTAGTGGKLPDGTTSQTIARDIAKLQGDLAKSGAVISSDGKTMTTKDGRKFDLSKGADGSMEGLMAMGLSASEASKAMDAGSKYGAAANAKYGAMMAKMADGGGGGGGAGRSPADDGSGGGGGRGFAWGDPRNKARAKAKVAGLSRKLGDDTIGVAGDDIFEMVTRRYKARDQNGNFLKD
jgi:hypothetical protein